mmetsp:Transcript_12443/g.26864  ORF Transcript_12443/g.26864 Transcript_12443/m.26864 type:complete len:491 (-) Transcript_12443:204-1676(-)|eukprot:CAMPEP_0202903558 /NCGR_PEP_ID=MMETSP1392-20130828/25172_1 /ASSEMBLY_ACC=CAM_ASM_000868 /TAXON_ID=225041 /ORGANISM="Chlamydomonas chlamydogama, Strain SAG 11-48b" /LENGTH=490 /DNA_ID=CAMNT_0049590801 /DNA_START=23 /DNA_END=1498 /DNA_ORIENTATION=+
MQAPLLPQRVQENSGVANATHKQTSVAWKTVATSFVLGCVTTVAVTLLLVSIHTKLHHIRIGLGRVPSWTGNPGSPENTLRDDLDTCEDYLGWDVDQRFSVVLTADPGTFSGTPEAHFILDNLKYPKEKPHANTVCSGHVVGELMGQPVLVVTTGIGPSAASLCTYEVVTACGSWIKEMVYFGTSGWSPQLGGVLNPPDCSVANDNQRIVRTGDVCISPFTVNWTCKKATWDMQAQGVPNQCTRPREVAGPNATELFGQCMFYKDNTHFNLMLSEELLEAARSYMGAGNFPRRSANVSAQEKRYWSTMSRGTRQPYPDLNPSMPPTVWDYKQCMEVDNQFFFSGVPWELKARDYAAMTLNAGLGLRGSTALSAHDVLAISAMEGIGVAEAMEKYHALSSTRHKIPYTNIRTASNWIHQPVQQTSPGVWEVFEEVPEDFVNGYAYAIASGSAAILTFYQARCIRMAAERLLPPGASCDFKISYNSGHSRVA